MFATQTCIFGAYNWGDKTKTVGSSWLGGQSRYRVKFICRKYFVELNKRLWISNADIFKCVCMWGGGQPSLSFKKNKSCLQIFFYLLISELLKKVGIDQLLTDLNFNGWTRAPWSVHLLQQQTGHEFTTKTNWNWTAG